MKTTKYSRELSIDRQLEVIDRNIAENHEKAKDPVFADEAAECEARVNRLLEVRFEIQEDLAKAALREGLDE